jgi:hypothetical protein
MYPRAASKLAAAKRGSGLSNIESRFGDFYLYCGFKKPFLSVWVNSLLAQILILPPG